MDAGADHAGLEDYVEKIQDGWTDVDVVIATPDVMAHVGKMVEYSDRKAYAKPQERYCNDGCRKRC